MTTNNPIVGETRPLRALSMLNRAAYNRSTAERILAAAGLSAHTPATGVVYQSVGRNVISEVWVTDKPQAYDLDAYYRRIQ